MIRADSYEKQLTTQVTRNGARLDEEMAANTSVTNTTIHVCLETVLYVKSSPSKAFTISAIAVCTVNAILAIAGILVNSLVITAFWKSPLLRSKAPFFLIMLLSVADLLVGLTVHPLYILALVKQVTGSGDCTTKAIYLFVATLLPGFSGLTLNVINMERYLAIVYPFIYQRHVTKTKLMVAILVLWAFWTPVPIVSFFNSKLQNVLISTMTAIVCIKTIYIYAKIFQIARRKRRLEPKPSILSHTAQESSVTGLESTVTSGVSRRSRLSEVMKDIKLAKMFILIVICSQVCYLPEVAYHLYHRFKANTKKTETSLMLGSWVMTFITLNSVLNSLIFFWKNSHLRKEVLRIVKGE